MGKVPRVGRKPPRAASSTGILFLLCAQVAVNDGVALWIRLVYYGACSVVLPVYLSGRPSDAATIIAYPSASAKSPGSIVAARG